MKRFVVLSASDTRADQGARHRPRALREQSSAHERYEALEARTRGGGTDDFQKRSECAKPISGHVATSGCGNDLEPVTWLPHPPRD